MVLQKKVWFTLRLLNSSPKPSPPLNVARVLTSLPSVCCLLSLQWVLPLASFVPSEVLPLLRHILLLPPQKRASSLMLPQPPRRKRQM